MKRLVLSTSALALLSGIALAAPAQAGSYDRHGNVTYSERAAIARTVGKARRNLTQRYRDMLRRRGAVSVTGE